MYYVTCDGFPLLDWRINNLILVNPRVKLEVNTVGEGSFTIYRSHPWYDVIRKLKSVIEIKDENSVIFRGRATGDTVDFDHGMAVDLEGAMAFFNDSVVRPFHLPDDFTENADYIAAAENGNVIEFFLGWLINNHNAQVEDFQKMKLGNVTVRDPNNYITRSNSDYASTWATLKDKLFDSSLGGYLCVRYEADGTYIDYLEDFTEVNTQEIAFGENILDLKTATEASGTYSAIIPIGALGLTIEGVADGDITEDLVKSGDTIYSKSAVAEYGWIYAPTPDTTWDDVTEESNLVKKGGEWLLNGGMLLSHGVEVTAVDLHFSDSQIESLRIYKKINARSAPHNLTEQFSLTKLEIELLEPQNTKISIGKTVVPLSERTIKQEEEIRKKYSKLSKSDEEIKMEVVDLLANAEARWTASVDGFSQTVQGYTKAVEGYDQTVGEYGNAVEVYSKQVSAFEQTAAGFKLSVDNLDAKVSSSLTLDANGLIVSGNGGSVTISGGQIDASTIKAGDLKLTGTLSWSDFTDNEAAAALKLDANGLVCTGAGGTVTISGGQIDATGLKVDAANITGTLTANQIDATGLKVDAANITGTLTIGSLPDSVASKSDIPTNTNQLTNGAGFVTSGTVTTITNNAIKTASIEADQITSGKFAAASLALDGLLELTHGNTCYGYMGVNLSKGGPVISDSGKNNFFVATANAAKISYKEEKMIWVASGGCYSSETMKVYSDQRLKNNINYDFTAEEVFFASLKPCSFQMNNDKSEKKRWGFIAQDVIEGAAAAGFDSEKLAAIGNYEGMNSLAYDEFIALNTYMIQKLMGRVTELEKKTQGVMT